MKDVLDRSISGWPAAMGWRWPRWSRSSARRRARPGRNGDQRARRVCGAVSGGCVEGAVVEHAEEVLAAASRGCCTPASSTADAWDVGLPCGGEIDVWVERFEL